MATLYVATSGSDTNPGTSSSPLHSIQAAVTAAASGDEIRVAAGTYTYDPSADHFGPKGQFSYSGTFGAKSVVAIQGKQLTIRGGFSASNFNVSDPASNPTIIDGQNQNRGIFVIGQKPTSLDLEGFTIRDALATGLPNRTGASQVYAFGGGLFADMGGDQNDPSPWILKDLTFENDRAVASGLFQGDGARAAGGAIALRYVTNATLSDIVFTGNQAVGAGGGTAGGGALGGAIHVDHSNITGQDLAFLGNTAQAGSDTGGSGVGQGGESADGLGGAVAVQSGSRVVLTHITATGNKAVGGNSAGKGGSGFGGAFYGEGSDVVLNLDGAFLQGNTAQGGNGPIGGLAGGGAIQTHDAALTLTNSLVVNNTAQGGNSGGSTGGTANGGGIFLSVFSGSAPSTITNSVIADNATALGSGGDAGGGGGGAYFQNVSAALSRVTIDDNRIDPRQGVGQGLLVLGTSAVTLTNSIVSNHTQTAASGAVDVLAGSLALNKVLSFNNLTFASPFSGNRITGQPITSRPTTEVPNLYDSPGASTWDYRLNSNIPNNPAIQANVGTNVNPGVDDGARITNPVTNLPSGGGQLSGFFASIVQVRRSRKGITGVVLQFNAALSPKLAMRRKAYILQSLSGRRGPKIAGIRFMKAANAVVLRFNGPIRTGTSAALVLAAPAFQDLTGRPLGGTTSFTLTA